MSDDAIKILEAQIAELKAAGPKKKSDFDDKLEYIKYLLGIAELDVRYNILKDRLEIDGEPADYTDLRSRIVDEFSYGLPIEERQFVIRWYEKNKPFDPIRTYLDSLPTKFVKQPEEHIAQIFGFAPDSFDTKLILMNLLGAVYRGFEPGCKMDSVLVLIGGQGLKKSTVFKALMPDEELFVEPKKQRSEVHELQVFHQHWLVNLSEIDTMFSRKSIEEIKDFITSEKDVMVKPYAPDPKTYYRQFILVGSTNEDELFRDYENRRYHCIRLFNELDVEYARTNRDDLWAGLVQMYFAKQQYWFERGSAEAELVRERNLQYREESPFNDKLTRWLSFHGDKPFKLTDCAEKILDFVDNKKLKQLKVELKALGYESKRMYTDEGRSRFWVKEVSR